jgi:aspartate aminotransferase-like enzyme
MLLFTPGPTPVPEDVRAAMSGPTLHHRTPEFEAIFKQTRQKLFTLFGMDEVLMLASSGSGAMEAAVTNLCVKKILVVNSGKFGARFVQIAQAFGKEVVELGYEWDTPVKLADVESALKDHDDIDALCMQVSESSGGLRHNVEEVAKLAKEYDENISVIADGITAVGVESIETTHIDCLITGSQKALMLPPGLAMMGLSHEACAKIGKGSGYYFNLAAELKKQRQNTTAYTAATTLIIGLNAMLEKVEDFGLENLYDVTKKRAKAVGEAMQTIGLEIYPKQPALSMCTLYSDKAGEIKEVLKKQYGVNVAGGQDHLKGRIFRINQMGIIEPHEIAWVCDSVEKAMDDLKMRKYTGIANATFNAVYYDK